MLTIFFILLLGATGFLVISVARSKSREKAEAQEDLDRVIRTAEEDVTVFGEELSELDGEASMADLDSAGRQDYQRALDSYETAKRTLLQVRRPDDIKNVTEALEDGRYAASCVKARVAGLPLPVRRPPCFFNPQHGPSVQDVDWAPVGGEVRPVPVCLADAERVECGAEPAVRKVAVGPGGARRAYWEAGDAYAPYNQGYFQSYAGSGLLPGVLMGAMMFGGFGGGWGGDYGSMGGDAGGDMGGDAGGDFGGGDFGGGDMGGDFGGFGDPLRMRAEHVQIRDESIRLGQLLKLTGMVEHGAEAKAVIEAGEVEVNGIVEERRGRTLVSGDQIACGGRTAIID